jgi:hypothetical protein
MSASTFKGFSRFFVPTRMSRLANHRERYLTRGKFSNAKFEQECLTEYAETFLTVCGDLTFYQFPSEEYWAKLLAATPQEFVLGLDVPDAARSSGAP